LSSNNTWQDLFESWVACRQSEIGEIKDRAVQRELALLQAALQRSHGREAGQLQSWLRTRADDICGPYHPRTGDLFGATASGPGWRLLQEPLDRLTAFVADSTNTSQRRRDAANVVALFRQRTDALAARATLFPPAIAPIGMLMLVPRTLAR
jgi:hypothetical protein